MTGTPSLNSLQRNLTYWLQEIPSQYDTEVKTALIKTIDTASPTTAPELPTKEDLMQLAYKYFDFRGNLRGEFFFATSIEAKTDPYQSLTSFAHAVLEQWGK